MGFKTYMQFFLGLLVLSGFFSFILFFLNPKLSPKELFHSQDNWVLMLDVSGSMVGERGVFNGRVIEGEDIFDEAKQDLINLTLRYFEKGSLYEFYTFNETTSRIDKGLIDEIGNVDALVSAIKGVNRPSGNTTCLSGALEKGARRAKALSSMNDQPTRLILVTDGEDSPDICPPLRSGKLGVTYILEKEYLRLYPLGYASNPKSNPLLRYCFLDLNSSKLTYFQIVLIAIGTLVLLSIIWHYLFLYFVGVSIRNRNNFNLIGGIFAWFFNQWSEVKMSQSNPEVMRGRTWKYGVVILLHSVPASFLAYYSFCYLWHPLLIFNGFVFLCTILVGVFRI